MSQQPVVNERFTMWGPGYINAHGVAVLSAKRKMDSDIAYAYQYIRDGWAREAQNGLINMIPRTECPKVITHTAQIVTALLIQQKKHMIRTDTKPKQR